MITVWKFDGIEMECKAADGTIVKGLLEEVRFDVKDIAGAPTGQINATVKLLQVRAETPFTEKAK